MSTGGDFQLITNNGAPDKLLLESEKLSKRLYNKTIKIEEKYKEDITSYTNYYDNLNLLLIEEQNKKIQNKEEQTKIINEINKTVDYINTLKINKTKTNPTLNDLQDTHILYLFSTFKPYVAIAYEYNKTLINGSKPSVGVDVQFTIPKYGHFFSDMVLYIKLCDLSPVNSLNRVKYCEFLGHRLLKKVEFSVNNNILDEYTTEDYNFHYQYKVPNNKKNAWLKCIGQEIPKKGYITNDPANQNIKESIDIYDGPQTLKSSHDNVELFIPLLFWFNDFSQAFSNISIPYGQTFIKMKFANKNEISSCSDIVGDGGLFNSPIIDKCELYVNHLFVNPDILDIYIKRIGFSLIRIHKYKEEILNQSSKSIKLNEFKFPIEHFFISLRPIENLEGVDNNDLWTKNEFLTQKKIKHPVLYNYNGDDETLGSNYLIYYEQQNVINELGLKAHEIILYQDIPSLFYNSYIPYNFGKYDINTPTDTGSHMITFNLYPGKYQPSGYLNISRTRELYLNYNSDNINASNPVKLFISASTFNFLLITDGSATLRYLT